MNRITLLHRTADLSVTRFDHPEHESHHDPEREVADGWRINFVRAGRFDVVVNGERKRLRRGSVFITRPGLAFRCEHGETCPKDVCLSVEFAPRAIAGEEDAWTKNPWIAREASSSRLAYASERLDHASHDENEFEIERWGAAALDALSVDARGRGSYTARIDDLCAVIESAQAIEAAPDARLSIADRARAVDRTGTQLTHAFRRYLGVSPHQYVIRWRLVDAAERLNAGASVSDACYRSGFENLSHFSRTFQKAFAVRASAWGSLPLAERRRKVQDLTMGPA